MKKRSISTLISIISGCVIGYLLYYYLLMELLSIFFGGGMFYYIISIICLLISIVGCSALVFLILTNCIKRSVLRVLFVAYFCIFFIALFARPSTHRIFIFNPLEGIRALTEIDMVLQSILNIAIFIPLGFFAKKWRFSKILMYTLSVSLGVELVQVIFKLGVFDTFDMLLYAVGLIFGTYLFKLWNFSVVE